MQSVQFNFLDMTENGLVKTRQIKVTSNRSNYINCSNDINKNGFISVISTKIKCSCFSCLQSPDVSITIFNAYISLKIKTDNVRKFSSICVDSIVHVQFRFWRIWTALFFSLLTYPVESNIYADGVVWFSLLNWFMMFEGASRMTFHAPQTTICDTIPLKYYVIRDRSSSSSC